MVTSSDIPLPPFLAPADLAARWGLTPMTLRRWRKDQKLKAIRLGRGVRFTAAEVQRIEAEAATR